MSGRIVDALVLLVMELSVVTAALHLQGEFHAAATFTQHVVPWSELVYCVAGAVAGVAFVLRSRQSWLAAALWTVGCTLAATFSARAYGNAPWNSVLPSGAFIVLLGAGMTWWIRRRTPA